MTHDTIGGGGRLGNEGACVTRGTHILTAQGEVPVEHLVPGQRIVLADGGEAPLLSVGERAIDCARWPMPEDVSPVRILKDALAPGLPHRDLVVSPGHAVFHQGTLIPAGNLVNGATVVQEPWVWVHYFHLELDRHAVILAENMPAESWLACGNRSTFDDAPAGPALPSGIEPGLPGCAPRARSGPLVDALRQRLLDRAPALGHALGCKPDLHLLIDGHRQELADAVLHPGMLDVLVVSRTGIPAQNHVGAADIRRLGVMLARIVLRDTYEERLIAMNHPALGPGFYGPEEHDGRTTRWTAGAAALPPVLWAGMVGPVRLELQVQHACLVWLPVPPAS